MLSDIRKSKNVQESPEEKTAPNKNKVTPKFPWLTLPHGPNCKQLSFYSLSDGKIYRFNLPPLLHGGVFCGSSKGWLIIAKEIFSMSDKLGNFGIKLWDAICKILGKEHYLKFYEVSESEMFLFNPITGVIHQLPSLSTIPSFPKGAIPDGYNVSCYVTRIELSSSNVTPECIVGGLFDRGRVLAFCRPGDKQWSIYSDCTSKDDTIDLVSDLLFYNDGFIAIAELGGFNEVPLHTIGLRDCQTILKVMPIFGIDDEDYDENVQVLDDYKISINDLDYTYLVESSSTGELLLILETIDSFTKINSLPGDMIHDAFEYKKRKAYNVFAVDPITGYMRKLKDIGDQVIFVTNDGSRCVSTGESDGTEGNCIYFAYNIDEHCFFQPLLSRELGIYYLDKGKFERPFPSAILPVYSKTSWFTPTLHNVVV